MDQERDAFPPELWSTLVVAATLASCDFATLLEEIRRAHGWTQKQLAAAVGYEKARRFRRSYTGPSTSHVRNFDEQLRSTLL